MCFFSLKSARILSALDHSNTHYWSQGLHSAILNQVTQLYLEEHFLVFFHNIEEVIEHE